MLFFKKSDLKIHHLFYFFIIYSFLGWCIETAYALAAYGHYIVRGLLDSPFCPIYGFGSLILIIFLSSIKNRPALFFLSSVALTTALEFFTGIVMRMVFHINAWDYSDEILNLFGIVCFRYSLIWGLLSALLIYTIHPLIRKILPLLKAS